MYHSVSQQHRLTGCQKVSCLRWTESADIFCHPFRTCANSSDPTKEVLNCLCTRKNRHLTSIAHRWRCGKYQASSTHAPGTQYFGIPATSVPSERILSEAGETVSWERASIKLSTVDMLMFFSKNHSVLDKNFCLTILSSVNVLDCP